MASCGRVYKDNNYPGMIYKDGRECTAMYKDNVKVWRFPARNSENYEYAHLLPDGSTYNLVGGYYERNGKRISDVGSFRKLIIDGSTLNNRLRRGEVDWYRAHDGGEFNAPEIEITYNYNEGTNGGWDDDSSTISSKVNDAASVLFLNNIHNKKITFHINNLFLNHGNTLSIYPLFRINGSNNEIIFNINGKMIDYGRIYITYSSFNGGGSDSGGGDRRTHSEWGDTRTGGCAIINGNGNRVTVNNNAGIRWLFKDNRDLLIQTALRMYRVRSGGNGHVGMDFIDSGLENTRFFALGGSSFTG